MIRRDGSQNGRTFYAAAIVVVSLLGLGSLALRSRWPLAMDKAGDALWASLVFMVISFIVPRLGLRWRGAIALGIAFVVEFSQLYHAAWIDEIRGHFIGRVFLGMGFDEWDLASYAVGVGLGVLTTAAAAGRRARVRR